MPTVAPYSAVKRSDPPRRARRGKAGRATWPMGMPSLTSAHAQAAARRRLYVSNAFGTRARRMVLTLQGTMPRDDAVTPSPCADEQGFSLHAAVRGGAGENKRQEQLCRYITPHSANMWSST